ncbi:unnamed protein product [Effrenium voratum]|nr:unnamed protein product [Effrenium voratum]
MSMWGAYAPRRRLRRKSTPPWRLRGPDLSNPWNVLIDPDPDGHYAALGIPRIANALKLRQAYLKRVLHVHPDRLPLRLGRQPTKREQRVAEEETQKVVKAFEVLCDEDRRRKYDHQGGILSPHSPTFDGPVSPCSPVLDPCVSDVSGRARVVLQDFLQGLALEEDLPTPVLLALRGLCSEEEREGETKGRAAAKTLDPCLYTQGGLYEAHVSWRGLCVQTRKTARLEQALAWRAALTDLRSRAQNRAKRYGGAPVLLEELRETYMTQPDMFLHFRFRHTPFTANLSLAISQNDAFKDLAARQMGRWRRAAEHAVEEDKRHTKRRCESLRRIISEQIDSRALQMEQRVLENEFLTQQLRATEQRILLTDMLGLDEAGADRGAAVLREVSWPERSRRLGRLLAPAHPLRALPPPRCENSPGGPPAKRRRVALPVTKFLSPGQGLEVALSLPLISLARFRAVCRSALIAAEEALRNRCRDFTVPCPLSLGGGKVSARGRPLQRSNSWATEVIARFLSQPRLSSLFGTLRLTGMAGSEVAECDSLRTALQSMANLQRVVLPSVGWKDTAQRSALVQSLQRCGVEVEVAQLA